MALSKAVSEKAERVEEIKNLVNQYKVIGAASLEKVRANQLQELRKKLQDSAYMCVVKNTLMKKAIAQSEDKPGLEKLGEYLSGSNVFLFTNLNPFKLLLILEKSKVKTTAKAGDIAAYDVVVPAGNTGLPPGPIISQLGAVGLPTRIESGSVWINRDTPVIKKGQVIDARLAAVLSKLGIKPVEVGLTMKVAYDDGVLITQEQMQIDLEGTKRSLEEAYTNAFNLSLKAFYPLPENIALLFQMARQGAYNLAINAAITAPAVMAALIRKAHAHMLSLSAKLKEK
ncbi:MAG: 50S ribosomal protein L10 [Candidatus Bathyarchaeia archaeon]